MIGSWDNQSYALSNQGALSCALRLGINLKKGASLLWCNTKSEQNMVICVRVKDGTYF